jgi:phytoene desaturase
MNKNKKIAIVGAGPGGLTAGMLLASQGYQVEIFEKGDVVGGRNMNIDINGYHFDAGPTFLLMKFVLDEMFKKAGRNSEDYLKFTKLDPMYLLNFEDKQLHVSSDHQKMYEEIKRVFPGNEEGYKNFLKDEKKKFDSMYPCLTVDYSSFSSLFSKNLIKAIPHLDLGKSVYDVTSKYFNDDTLKLSFTFQSKYLGMSPWKCPGAFTMLAYMEHEKGIYHVEGGLSKISEAMAKVIKEHDGTIHLSTPIKKVKTVDGVARGVVLESGEEITADAVFVNADFGYAATHLFDDGVMKKYTKKKVESMDYSCSTCMFYFGVDKIYDEEHHQIIFAKDYKKNVNDIFETGIVADDVSIYIRNASPLDKTIAPEGHSALYILVPVSNLKRGVNWEEEKHILREKVLKVIAERTSMKDLKDHITVEKIITPQDWQQDFNVFLGATFNLSHKLTQMLYLRPHNRFEDVKNCYLVGGGTHPGSGLPTIYESARISVDLFKKDQHE